MATSKPISTISYNTEPFLKEQLEKLYQAHIIQAYQYICHKGEGGDKDHIHLRIEPNKKLDPMDITDKLTEYVQGEAKPRVVRTWRPSNEEDWILYGIHDEDYLKLKDGEKNEKLPYSWKDIKAPDNYDVEIAFIRAKQKMSHTSGNVAKRLIDGESAMTLVTEGENPFKLNAIIRALKESDYERIVKNYNDLQKYLSGVLQAIEGAGFRYAGDDKQGLYMLVKVNENKKCSTFDGSTAEDVNDYFYD